jgi:hypothetical protein
MSSWPVFSGYVSVVALAVVLLGFWAALGYFVWRALTPRVFISYRHADNESGAVQHLRSYLAGHLGEGNVFMDNYALQEGQDFPQVLQTRLDESEVVLAVIGPNWAGFHPPLLYPRIVAHGDWVRHEVLAGLRVTNKLLVVRLGGTPMPSAESLGLEPAGKDGLIPLLNRESKNVLPLSGTEVEVAYRQLTAQIMGRRRKWRLAILGGWWLLGAVILFLGVSGTYWLVRVNETARQAAETGRRVEEEAQRREKLTEEFIAQVKQVRPYLDCDLSTFIERVQQHPEGKIGLQAFLGVAAAPGQGEAQNHQESQVGLKGRVVLWSARVKEAHFDPGSPPWLELVATEGRFPRFTVNAFFDGYAASTGALKALLQGHQEITILGQIDLEPDVTSVTLFQCSVVPRVGLR